MMRILSLIFILFVTVSCARKLPPAEVRDYGAKGGSSLGVIQVYEGDNLYKLAQRYRIPLRDLIEENDLSAPYKLASGQRLNIPAPRIYKAKEGDSYSSIALLYNLSITELVQQNNSQAPHTITAGQEIYLSKSKKEARAQEYKRQVASAQKAKTVKSTKTTTRTVKKTVGQDKLIYQQTYEAPVASEDSVQQRPTAEPIVVENIPAPSYPQEEQVIEQPVEVAVVVPSPQAIENVKTQTKINTPPARSGGKFNWPVQGKVLSKYGTKPGGLFNDGVNIGVPEGTTVRAAENGVVAYVGKDLKGFGNLVLIKHDDGYMTAYAHLKNSLVQRGAVLKKGQTLGTVGKTGSVNSPQLHFEVRKDGKPVDPSNYLI